MPSPCCPPDSIGAGVPSEVAPKGQLKEIVASSENNNGNVKLCPMPCYWTTGSSHATTIKAVTRVVLVFSDVYGFDSANHWNFADQLAERLNDSDAAAATRTTNTIVVVPDLFRGNPIMQPVLAKWLPSWLADALDSPLTLYRLKFKNSPQRIEQDLTQLILPWIRRQVESSSFKLACVGFCFGGWVMGRALTLCRDSDINNDDNKNTPRKLFECGVGIHASFQPQTVYGDMTEAELARRMGTTPCKMLLAKHDYFNPSESRVLQLLADVRGIPLEEVVEYYPTMSHGWVSRQNADTAHVRENQDRALSSTAMFIQRHA